MDRLVSQTLVRPFILIEDNCDFSYTCTWDTRP